jgi:hypothetical protein
MFFTDSLFIGIDPTSGHKSFVYAALDRDLNLAALADGELEDVTAFLAGQRSATVAVNAPARVNRGLVRGKMKKEMFTPHRIRRAEFRLAEFQLRERGIHVTGTPSRVEACPAWMQSGFALYRKLERMGFKKYPAENAPHQILETHPHACFCVLAGNAPLPKPSFEGKMQRQLLLFERGLRIRDPMEFFEEITRYKMMKGIFPVDMLYLPEQLDALAAAYTAWLAVNKADHISTVGDSKEGVIILPERELKENY